MYICDYDLYLAKCLFIPCMDSGRDTTEEQSRDGGQLWLTIWAIKLLTSRKQLALYLIHNGNPYTQLIGRVGGEICKMKPYNLDKFSLCSKFI